MIHIKTEKEIEIMREGGRILGGIMRGLEKEVRPGVKTGDLDKLAQELVFQFKAKPSFKGYRANKKTKPYPSVLCASVNEEIVHVVPSNRILKEGDIISLDLGIKYKGFHTDMAVTVPVGNISINAKKIMEVTRESLQEGLKEIKPNNHFGDIGAAIQKYAESCGFNVVRDLCGHGIGRNLHEEPEVLNFGKRGAGPEIKEGMVFCVEPMVTERDWRLKKCADGFGYKTADGKLSAHFEHTIAVTRDGYEVLTPLEVRPAKGTAAAA